MFMFYKQCILYTFVNKTYKMKKIYLIILFMCSLYISKGESYKNILDSYLINSNYNKDSLCINNSKIDTNVIKNYRSTNIIKLLQGNIPGVEVLDVDGSPGSIPKISIRGISNVYNNNGILFVVDDIVIRNDNIFIPISDVKEIKIVKSAISLGKYGKEASNGAIEIYTKTASQNGFSASSYSNIGFSEKGLKNYKTISAKERYELDFQYQLSRHNDKDDLSFRKLIAKNIIGFRQHNPYNVPNEEIIDYITGKLNPHAKLIYSNDIEKILEDSGIKQEYGGSVAYKNEIVNMYCGLSTMNQKGIYKHSSNDSKNSLVNIKLNANKRIRFGFSYRYSENNIKKTNPKILEQFRHLSPTARLYSRNKTTKEIETDSDNKKIFNNDLYDHPLILNNETDLSDKYLFFNTRAYIEIEPINDLKFKLQYNRSINSLNTTNNLIHDTQNQLKFYEGKKYETKNSLLEQNLQYKKAFFGNNLALYINHKNTESNYTYEDIFKENNTFFNTSPKHNNKDITTTYESYNFGINYNFREKYFADFIYRKENIKETKYSLIYKTFSFKWDISKEEFFSKIKHINKLCIFSNYGLSNKYTYFGEYQRFIDDNFFKFKTNIKDRYFSKFDLGIESSLFKNRISLGFNYFNNIGDKSNSNLYFLAQNRMSGIEYNINIIPINNSLKWNINFNITQLKSKIENIYDSEGNKEKNHPLLNNSIYSIYTNKYVGIDSDDGKEQWSYIDNTRDQDGNIISSKKEITKNYFESESQIVGNRMPDFYGGISNTLSYKNFSLFVNMSFSIGGEMYDYNYMKLCNYNNSNTNLQVHKDLLNYWTEEGHKSKFPKLRTYKMVDDSRYVINSSYLSINNINLSYNINSEFIKSIGIKSLAVNFNIENAYQFNHKQGMNAMTYITDSTVSYPLIRTYSFGLNINI